MSLVDKAIIQALVNGDHSTPYSILGMQQLDSSHLVVRTFQPYAKAVDVLNPETGRVHPAVCLHEKGFYEVIINGLQPFSYRLRMTGTDGNIWELADPYSFPLQITDFDMHLFGEGTNFRAYEKLGAHPMVINGVPGVHFAVWAPNAARVGLVGWFNRWDGRHHPMQNRGQSGIWELFVPALRPGDLYKFEIKGRNGYLAQKSDPYGVGTELRPQTASVVCDLKSYHWHDDSWMKKRAETQWCHRPVSVYEVHLGSWRRAAEDRNRWLSYRELANTLLPYVKEMGYTHIELLPITEHPFDGSWGYQTIGYFAPTSRFGTPQDFMYFVDRCHEEGIGVFLDWVPAHFPKDGHGLAYFDGTHLYEHADPRIGEHKEWGTFVFNYGRNEVRAFLLSSAVFWADVYHIDGLRVDAVASMLYLDYSRKSGEWVPNKFGGNENLEAVSFLKKFNEVVHAQYPGFLTSAEESTAWPMVSRPVYLGGLGFDLKWNMGWMHDILQYMEKEAVHRKFHHNSLTFSLLYAFTENFILSFSHDEVVHGKKSMLDKMPGDLWQKMANLRLLYSFMYAHPGKKLLFMGCEFGQWKEWDAQSSLDWPLLNDEKHQQLKGCVERLNQIYRDSPALYETDFSWDGFQWIDFHDTEQSVISFYRKSQDGQKILACALNFTPVPRRGYRVGLPSAGKYEEIFNSDDQQFGGSGVLNGVVEAEQIPWQGQPCSAVLTLPPLGAVWLQPKKEDAQLVSATKQLAKSKR